ncbi:MAG: S1 RNA-binding domain-containing protein [Spiroplasma sp.]
MDNISNTKFKVGDTIEVEITNFANFGVFSDCGDGYKGLIHVSNIANEYVKDAKNYFSVSEKVQAEIISIDNDTKKIGLSTKKFDLKSKNKSFNSSYSRNKKYNNNF